MSLSDLVSTLQLAIGPVILISGVGLLLLSMTNRYGRVIDRSRLLRQDLRETTEAAGRHVHDQLWILWRRARIIRAAIALASLSVLLAALLIITLFVGALFGWAVTVLLAALFVLCMAALIGSLVFFIVDINLSLKALKLEVPPEDQRRR